MPINEIVDVQIDRQTTVPTRAGFGTLLIAKEFEASGELSDFDRVETFGSLDEVEERFGTEDLVYSAASAVFSQSPRPPQIKVGRKDPVDDATWEAALTAINNADEDWYALAILTRTESDQEEAASWAEANDKLFGLASDATPGAPDTIFTHIQDNSYDRTWAFYHTGAVGDNNDPWPEAALFGKILPLDPGSATWWFKTLSGVPIDSLNSGDRSDLEGDGVMFYSAVAGVNLTRGGTVGSGEYIDVIRGIDWLKARLAEDIFTLLVNESKVPYTDAGIGGIESIVKGRLDIAVDRGVLADDPEPTVSVPEAVDVSTQDKGDRILRDVTWEAVLAGAIHKIEVRGVVTL